jgi:hypothetical protein
MALISAILRKIRNVLYGIRLSRKRLESAKKFIWKFPTIFAIIAGSLEQGAEHYSKQSGL